MFEGENLLLTVGGLLVLLPLLDLIFPKKIKKQKKKRISLSLIIILLGIICLSETETLGHLIELDIQIPEFNKQYTPNIPDSDVDMDADLLYVHFIDVGQGDAIYINYEDFDILIDAGDKPAGETVVNYLKQQEVDDIEILIATHPHADHIGGMDDVLYAFDVDMIIHSGDEHDTIAYEEYITAVKLEGASHIENDNMTFTISDDIYFEIIETGNDNGSLNNNSVFSKIVYNDVSYLFTGDMEAEVEEKVLDWDIQADVLKAGHHGSDTSSTPAFVDAVNPAYAIISVGEGNKYGHPGERTLNTFDQRDSSVFRTDHSGTIVSYTDGKSIGFEFEK